MNTNTSNECLPCPAADPWITCRSKSHHKRIYYYNTVTGEAIWNLTDFETDKCKKATKVSFESQDQSDSYPEPKEPPQDSCRNFFMSEVIEQNINTDFTSTSFNQCNINELFIDHRLSPNSVQRCDNINTLNDFMFRIPTAPTSTPNTSLSLLDQQQVNTKQVPNNKEDFKNNYVHTTSVPLNKRFQIIKNKNSSFRFVIPDHEENPTALEVSGIDTSQSIVTRDLRQILSLKRKFNVPNNIDQEIDYNRPKINSNAIGSLDVNNFKVYPTDNINQGHFINTAATNDTQNIGSNLEDCIFLVPDANVFQNHIRFLKFLIIFGETFHFLVLENVVTQIRNNSRSVGVEKRRRAQLAMTFISNNIRRGFVSIVQNPIDKKNSGRFYVLDCCLKLIEEHDKIILLSNYEQLKKHTKTHENAGRILILTVNELKSVVNTLGDGNLIRNKLYPKETCQDVSSQYVSNDQEYMLPDCDMIAEKVQKLDIKPIKVSVGVETNRCIDENNTVDACVQTDLDSELITRLLNTDSAKAILDDVKIKEMKKDNYNSFIKGWDVNLNSAKSVTKDIDNNEKQKNFKWRRKRPRSLIEQKEGIQNSLTNNVMVKIPKGIVFSEAGKLFNYKSITTDDNVPTTDGSSTSGIVSTAPSPNDYWTEYENTRNGLTLVDKESEKDSNNVMFEVTSKAMNENLISRSDEWVSRFVQIMEEALTQVLQKNPSQPPDVLAPPWTLFEATTCIKMKYRKDRDIVDAGNKLTNTLTKISDKKGTINIHPNPKQYMEMYSYGVYLIDSLQAAFDGCEDLQTASESLSKLLNDIQHPNLSTSQNDAFIDVQDESNTNTDSMKIAFQTNNDDSLIHQKTQIDLSSVCSPLKRKLRSKFINENNKVEERDNIKMFEKAESKTSLVSTLDSKNDNDVCEKESMRSFVDEEPHTPLYDPPTSHEVRTRNDTRNDTPINDTMTTINNDSKQPKIIINFTQCADYEEKLKRQALQLNDNDFDEFLEYNNDGDYTSDDEYDHYGNNREVPNKHFNFENIFNNMLLDIRQTFIIVFAFCMMCQNAIDISNPERKLLEAKEVYLKINNICNVLSRMIKRDDKLFMSNIAEVLKAENVMEDFTFDESDLRKYREIITKYLDQANLLRECLETILRQMN